MSGFTTSTPLLGAGAGRFALGEKTNTVKHPHLPRHELPLKSSASAPNFNLHQLLHPTELFPKNQASEIEVGKLEVNTLDYGFGPRPGPSEAGVSRHRQQQMDHEAGGGSDGELELTGIDDDEDDEFGEIEFMPQPNYHDDYFPSLPDPEQFTTFRANLVRADPDPDEDEMWALKYPKGRCIGLGHDDIEDCCGFSYEELPDDETWFENTPVDANDVVLSNY